MKNLFSKISRLAFLFSLFAALNVSAQSNQYLDFDGIDDFVTVDNASQLIAGSTAMSMTGWFYCNALSYGQGMMGFRATQGGFYLIQLNNGVIECRFLNSNGTLYEYVAPANTTVPQVWQHFAWVYTGSQVQLYVNGNLSGSVAASGTINNTAIQFAIGKSILSGFNFVYNGRIDEVSVWNKALTQTEIQDMMNNELLGTEPNLQLYYKFNQGVPGGNNTGITSLITEVNAPTYNGNFNLFALTGPTSNFNGSLNPSFQAISFPQLPDKLTTDPPFKLTATATSGLQVLYNLVSGPASISNDSVYLAGTPGQVTIRAYQPGNASYDSATSIYNTFNVIDPALNVPVIEPRNPVNGADVYMPTLSTMQLAAKVNIPYPALFSVQNVQFVINGQTIPATDHQNQHYTGWWTPPAYGPYTIQIVSTSNFGAVATETVNINVVSSVSTLSNVPAFSGIWLDANTPSATADGVLPSYVGAFDTIVATLTVTCPPGGCGPWDRVASIDLQGHDGKWFEIIRYITPYGVPCSHSINLADYMSLLQGKVTFRANCATLDNGFQYALSFTFKDGAPPHKYSRVEQVWKNIYPFGDYANLQPVPAFAINYPNLTVESKLKLVSTGHGWGNLNTGNAAEFYNATHSLWVNGSNTYSQQNWTTCNPNPDACQPQNGTWTYNRAGWCPGSIARYFDYDFTPFISSNPVNLEYKFFSGYVDLCHPNHPNCVTGVTCSDCGDGFNPTLDVNCNIVYWFDDPAALSVNEQDQLSFVIFPNPSSGMLNMGALSTGKKYTVTVMNVLGNTVKKFDWNGQLIQLDLTSYSKGIYMVKVSDSKNTQVKKLVVQ